MGNITLEALSQQYYDVLKELGNIGAGNAMTALSQLLQCKVDMKVPQVKLLEFAEVAGTMGGEEQIMAGIFLGVDGEISGSIMFLIEDGAARHLIEKLMGMSLPDACWDEMSISALKEVGNIITGAYLNSLSTLTNLKIYPSVPELAIDMSGAILSVPAIQFGIVGDKILLIQSQFSDEVEINGYFILMPDLESYDKLLRSLGIV